MIREVKVMIRQDVMRKMVRHLGYIPAYLVYTGNEVTAVKTYCPNCFMPIELKGIMEEVENKQHLDTNFGHCYACNTVLRITYDSSRGFRSSFFMVYSADETNQPEREDKNVV